MPLDLPDSPATNATYTFGGVTWKYDGAKWRLLAGSSVPPLVSTLPTSPTDGQEVYYQASGDMATNGIVWHLRYRSASSSSYKWEYIGGGPLWAQSLGEVSSALTATTWSDVGTAISVTAPLEGDYFVTGTSSISHNGAATNTQLGIKKGTTDPGSPGSAFATYTENPQGKWQSASVSGPLTGVGASGASKAITLQYRGDLGATANNFARKGATLEVRPIRVI